MGELQGKSVLGLGNSMCEGPGHGPREAESEAECGIHVGRMNSPEVSLGHLSFPFVLVLCLYTSSNPTTVWLHLNASEMKSLRLMVLSDAKASFLFSSFSQNAIYEFLGRI